MSTKYIHHYLAWFIRYDGAGQQSLDARISAFVLESMSAPVPVRTWRLTRDGNSGLGCEFHASKG